MSKVRNILEAQLPRPNARVPELKAPTTETITIRTDPRQFESFLRSINRCSSLLDARRLKNDIMNEIRRNRTLLGLYRINYLSLLEHILTTTEQRTTRRTTGSTARRLKTSSLS